MERSLNEIMQEFINSGKLTPPQIKALTGK
jgi:hypothetical protein